MRLRIVYVSLLPAMLLLKLMYCAVFTTSPVTGLHPKWTAVLTRNDASQEPLGFINPD